MNFDIGIYSFIAMHKKETNMHLLLKLGFHHYSCKRLVPSRLHELHESKFPFVTRIEFIRSKLSNCSAHVSGDSAGLGWITGIYVRRLPQRSRNGGATPMRPHAVEGNGSAGLVRTGASGDRAVGAVGRPTGQTSHGVSDVLDRINKLKLDTKKHTSVNNCLF